jgi:hypothetical protein
VSRRFGRNQKREMRRKIESLATEVAFLKAINEEKTKRIFSQKREIESFNEDFEVLREVLGEYFVGLPPLTIFSDSLTVNRKFQIYEKVSWDNLNREDFTATVKSLERVITKAELDDLKGAMHVRVTTPVGDIGYYTDLESMKFLPKDVLIERISKEIAIQLSHSLENLK